MTPEKEKWYQLTMLEGNVETLKFIKEAPSNVFLFENKQGEHLSIPTGGFTSITEVTKKSNSST